MSNNAQENIEYYKGDDLFSVAWIGPTVSKNSPDAARKLQELQRVFQPHNVLKELIDNWRDGLISKPFTWYLKDSKGERTQAEEAEIQLQRWIDFVNQQAIFADPECSHFQEVTPWAEFILMAGVAGEANLRLWQPQRFADAEDPVHRIHLHTPLIGKVNIERDDDGFIESVEYSYGSGKTEKHSISETGDIIVETADADENLQLDTEQRWLIQQIQRPPLVTPSAKAKQAAIIHALTMKVMNNDLAGFRERVLLNAQFPEDDDGNPLPVHKGPGIDRYEYGIPQGPPDTPTYTNPTVHESEPVSISNLADSVDMDRRLLYLEFKQAHLLTNNDGRLSAESRAQARQNFQTHLEGWAIPIQAAFANVLNIVLRLLGYENLEVVVELAINTGKLSPEEREQLLKEYQAGAMSKATLIAKLGTVADVDAELALIEEELAKRSAPVLDPLPSNPDDDDPTPDDE